MIPYGDYIVEEESVGSDAFHLTACNEKLNKETIELEAKAWGAFDKSYYNASNKRRKLSGFERAIWLVHDNRNVGKFDAFMKNTSYDDKDPNYKKIPTDRKRRCEGIGSAH